jgi:hypothetical protein
LQKKSRTHYLLLRFVAFLSGADTKASSRSLEIN